MDYELRPGQPGDIAGIIALLPRLADFTIPDHRVSQDLWLGDQDLVQAWAAGDRADVQVMVAVGNNELLGVAVVSARKELLSGGPSAHLEVLAIDAKAEGNGIGSALLGTVDDIALSMGAQSLSLNVFSNNQRARALYERNGYDGELIRYFKKLT